MQLKKFLESLIFEDDCNFYQIFLMSQEDTDKSSQSESCSEVTEYNTALSKAEYYGMMARLMDKNYKFHQKQYIETVIGNTHFLNHKNEDINIYQLSTTNFTMFQKSIVAFRQNKTKLSIISFPSTRNIHCETCQNVLSFRISNRVLINFVNGVHLNENFYNIVLSYTNDKNVDKNNVINDIEKVLKIALNMN
jgi:hypothetical protein